MKPSLRILLVFALAALDTKLTSSADCDIASCGSSAKLTATLNSFECSSNPGTNCPTSGCTSADTLTAEVRVDYSGLAPTCAPDSRLAIVCYQFKNGSGTTICSGCEEFPINISTSGVGGQSRDIECTPGTQGTYTFSYTANDVGPNTQAGCDCDAGCVNNCLLFCDERASYGPSCSITL